MNLLHWLPVIGLFFPDKKYDKTKQRIWAAYQFFCVLVFLAVVVVVIIIWEANNKIVE